MVTSTPNSAAHENCHAHFKTLRQPGYSKFLATKICTELVFCINIMFT